MEVNQVLCMNGGEGKTSYAQNCSIQNMVLHKVKDILEESVRELYVTSPTACLKIADFGCSSGQNTLLFIWEILGIVNEMHKQFGHHKSPMFQVFLNDLPGNDFNTVFRLLPNFYKKLKKTKGDDFGPCFVAGVPGSFYGRLFPNHFLHFAHSCYSLHWRSQVSDGLVSESGSPLNKSCIYLTKTSPGRVYEAYSNLFQKDFVSFLRSRSEELISQGHMVLTMIGSYNNSAYSTGKDRTIPELLGIALRDMVIEGVIEESKLDEFDVPYYAPDAEEIRNAIQKEGSFHIQKLETFELDWDASLDSDSRIQNNYACRGKRVAIGVRAVFETILASHFGESVMENLFERLSAKVAKVLEANEGKYVNIVISMKKK